MTDIVERISQLPELANLPGGALAADCFEAAIEIKKLRAENETHKEIAVRETMNVATLRAALKPFADAADDFIAEKPDITRAIVSLGDLRAAAAALKETHND